MEELRNHLQNKYEKDFKVSVENDGLTMTSLNNCLVIGWINYFPEVKIREKVIFSKRFDEVEEILEPIFLKHHINRGAYGGFNSTINEFKAFNKEPILINTRSSFGRNLLANQLDRLIDDYFESFKNENSTIEQVHLKSESLTPQELADYLRQPPAFRRMILKKLVKDDNFNDFSLQYVQSAKVKASQKATFKNFDLAAKDLYEVLKNALPNENGITIE